MSDSLSTEIIWKDVIVMLVAAIPFVFVTTFSPELHWWIMAVLVAWPLIIGWAWGAWRKKH